MEDLLMLFVQFVFECFTQIASLTPDVFGLDTFDFIPVGVFIFIAGALIGVVSLNEWPHVFLHPGSLRIANLATFPWICGWIARSIHCFLAGFRSGASIACFRRTAIFVSGFLLMRFAYGVR